MINIPSESEEPKGTILFIHGMCQAAWCWDQGFMQEFAKAGYNCYAVDLPLHDQPGKNKAVNSQSIDDYVLFVKETIDQLGKDVIIVGHSMGGFITQKFLEKHSCSAAILLASVPPSGILSGSLRFLMRHPDAFPSLITRDIFGPFVKYADDLYSKNTTKADIEGYKKLMRSESFKALLNMMFRPVRTPNLHNVPLLITGADQDRVIAVKEIKKTGEFYNQEVFLFSDYGHNLMLDKGYESICIKIMNWIGSAVNE